MHSPGRTVRAVAGAGERRSLPHASLCSLIALSHSGGGTAPRVQESKTGVRLSRVHFKIWVDQGLAPLLRRNPVPLADATLQPAWTDL